MAVPDLLLTNTGAPIRIVLFVKYSNFTVTFFLRGHEAYME